MWPHHFSYAAGMFGAFMSPVWQDQIATSTFMCQLTDSLRVWERLIGVTFASWLLQHELIKHFLFRNSAQLLAQDLLISNCSGLGFIFCQATISPCIAFICGCLGKSLCCTTAVLKTCKSKQGFAQLWQINLQREHVPTEITNERVSRWNIWCEWLSDTTTPNLSSISLNLTELKPFLCLPVSAGCGSNWVESKPKKNCELF